MSETLEYPIIAIDGPSGSGKGTISRLLAQRLGWHMLDSGALYRVLAFDVMNQGISQNDEVAIANAAKALPVRFDESQILLRDQNVTEAIRSEECGKTASVISAFAVVRAALTARQRAFCQHPGLVADGRDMGTVIFPEAVVKIFLDGSVKARAKRRFEQLLQKGMLVNYKDVLHELEIRDDRDRNRKVAPLKPAPDSVIIDTTELSVDAVYKDVMKLIHERGLV